MVFEIAAPHLAAFNAVAGGVRANFDAVIVPALHAALDRIDRRGQVIRFDRIDVDLGTLTTAPPTAAELARRIGDGLAAIFAAAPSPESRSELHARDDIAELAAFLETGEMPWSEPGRALAALVASLLSLETPQMARLARQLRGVLRHRRASERLVRQLPARLVFRLIHGLLPEAMAAQFADVFGLDTEDPAVGSRPAPERLALPLAELVRHLAGGVRTVDFAQVVDLVAALSGRAPSVAMPRAIAVQDRAGSSPSPAAPGETPASDESAADEAREEPRTDARPVHAAGAVLLHPFLSTFFERLGLLAESGQFRDPAARARAVLLSYHLATGAEQAPEPDTTLFKLLCGMAIADPIPRRIDLKDSERAEAEALLASVIAHWGRLGNTSPQGLREGFLLRPGRLERQGDIWRLTVERRGIDVLLAALPWTLSRVKTRFMRALLMVDWG